MMQVIWTCPKTTKDPPAEGQFSQYPGRMAVAMLSTMDGAKTLLPCSRFLTFNSCLSVSPSLTTVARHRLPRLLFFQLLLPPLIPLPCYCRRLFFRSPPSTHVPRRVIGSQQWWRPRKGDEWTLNLLRSLSTAVFMEIEPRLAMLSSSRCQLSARKSIFN